jgi:repressor LexA
MPEVATEPPVIRPTKKQQELLVFIQNFVSEHGYGPSYREIMVGCNYTSVATVALHVNNLIKRGHLRKKDRSARSLEVIAELPKETALKTNEVKPAEEKWLVEKIDYKFKQLEEGQTIMQADIDDLYILISALKVLGVEAAAVSFSTRLTDLKKRLS